MTARNVAHSSFVIERDLSAPPARVFHAFADPDTNLSWSDCHADVPGSHHSFDFRVGGEERHEATHPDGGRQVVLKRFLDIAPDRRIVFAYDITLDGRRLSASLVTVECAAAGESRTHMIYTEQIAYLDGHDDLQERIRGTGEGLDRLVLMLSEGTRQ